MSDHDEETFLQAVIENPDDDGLRLVYADWLEEHGQQERAEFIRLQCELVRMAEDDPNREGLRVRERELLKRHESNWVGPLRQWVAWEFRRGFVEAITVKPDVFLGHADDLFRATPIRRVTFQNLMFQLAQPNLVFPSTGPLLPRLAACPHLARLSALGFWHNHIGDGGMAALAASPNLARLVSLDLTWNDLGDAGLLVLAASPSLSKLGSLKLSGNRVGPAGARSLAGSKNVTQLELLDLGGNPVGDEGVQALAASPNVSKLVKLDLSASGLGTAGALALAGSPYLARLKSLNVQGNVIGNKARQALRLRFGKGKVRF